MPTIRESIAKYLAELTRRGASPHTLRNYGSDLEQFAAYFEPSGAPVPLLEELDLALLREWLGGLYYHKLSVVTVRRKLAAVRAVFKFSMQEGVITRNPATRLRTPKVRPRLPEVMSAEKTNNLIDAVDSGEVVEMPDKERDVALLELMYGCGIRVSELVGINLDDVDLHSGWLRVRGKGNKERQVPVAARAVDAVNVYLQKRAAPPAERSTPSSLPVTQLSTHIASATLTPPTSSVTVQISVPSRNSSATPACPPLKNTPKSPSQTSNASTTAPTPKHKVNRPVSKTTTSTQTVSALKDKSSESSQTPHQWSSYPVLQS